MLGMVLLSNIAYLFCNLWLLGFSKAKPAIIDGSFARIRVVSLFSAFAQIVVFVLSFADGEVGGTCSETKLLPYLFDGLYGLQIFACFIFFMEKFCGYGSTRVKRAAKKKDSKGEEETTAAGGKTKREEVDLRIEVPDAQRWSELCFQ